MRYGLCLHLMMILAAASGASSAFGKSPEEPTILPRALFAEEIRDRPLSFLARQIESGETCLLDGSLIHERHPPWSSFKIPNLLIALETGVSESLSSKRVWSAERRPPSAYWPERWRRDHTLRTAFRDSVVWYFQDIALEVGTARYRQYLTEWAYGNASVPDGSDTFWLGSSLRISLAEQVAYLERLLSGELNVTSSAMDALRDASRLWVSSGRRIHGKTGAGYFENGDTFEGWFVGWTEVPQTAPIVFALYTRAEKFSDLHKFRLRIAPTLLQACGWNVGDARLTR